MVTAASNDAASMPPAGAIVQRLPGVVGVPKRADFWDTHLSGRPGCDHGNSSSAGLAQFEDDCRDVILRLFFFVMFMILMDLPVG